MKAQDIGCYCDTNLCNEGDMCKSDTGGCYPNVENCPNVLTTISDPACFCPSASKLCLKDQVCNDMVNDCTDPLPTCPDYPEVAEGYGCSCQESRECKSGELCSPDGECRTPVPCEDPAQDQSLNLNITTENATLTEGHNISLQCLDCHYVTGYPDENGYEVSCLPSGQWNTTIVGCSNIHCNDIDVDDHTVDEKQEDVHSSCHPIRTFSCKYDLEVFSFGNKEVSFHCTSRYNCLNINF